MPKVKIKGYKKIAEVLIHWQIFLIIQKILTVLSIILQQQIFLSVSVQQFLFYVNLFRKAYRANSCALLFFSCATFFLLFYAD